MFTWKKYVCEVYRERSFSKAAQNLYISQPSLSARIKKVEEQIGVPLFDRSTSPLQLTEAGRIYIRAAEEISVIEQRVENAINNLNTLQTGRLSIGASNLFAAYVLPPLISRFNSVIPRSTSRSSRATPTSWRRCSAAEDWILSLTTIIMTALFTAKNPTVPSTFCWRVPRHFPINKELEMFQLSFEDIRGEGASDADTPDVPLAYFSSLPFIMLTPATTPGSAESDSAMKPAFRRTSSWSFSSRPPLTWPLPPSLALLLSAICWCGAFLPLKIWCTINWPATRPCAVCSSIIKGTNTKPGQWKNLSLLCTHPAIQFLHRTIQQRHRDHKKYNIDHRGWDGRR